MTTIYLIGGAIFFVAAIFLIFKMDDKPKVNQHDQTLYRRRNNNRN